MRRGSPHVLGMHEVRWVCEEDEARGGEERRERVSAHCRFLSTSSPHHTSNHRPSPSAHAMMASSAPPPPADNPYHDPALPPPDNSRHHGQALPPPVASVLLVPRARVGRVIGRAGETIRALQTYTGASIQIAQESDPCRVVLAGPPPAVALAECLVRDIVAGCFKGFALLRQQAGAGAEARHPDTRPAYLPGYGLVPPSALAVAVSYLAEGREERVRGVVGFSPRRWGGAFCVGGPNSLLPSRSLSHDAYQGARRVLQARSGGAEAGTCLPWRHERGVSLPCRAACAGAPCNARTPLCSRPARQPCASISHHPRVRGSGVWASSHRGREWSRAGERGRGGPRKRAPPLAGMRRPPLSLCPFFALGPRTAPSRVVGGGGTPAPKPAESTDALFAQSLVCV